MPAHVEEAPDHLVLAADQQHGLAPDLAPDEPARRGDLVGPAHVIPLPLEDLLALGGQHARIGVVPALERRRERGLCVDGHQLPPSWR